MKKNKTLYTKINKTLNLIFIQMEMINPKFEMIIH